MIPNAKELDLHQNDMGVLCTVSETGQLIPYNRPNTIISDEPVAIVLELSDQPKPVEHPLPPSSLEIATMGWRQIKSYCTENGFLDKPENESWEDYLIRQLYPEDPANE